MVYDPHPTRRSYPPRTEIPSPPGITTASPGPPGDGSALLHSLVAGSHRHPSGLLRPDRAQRVEGLPRPGNRRTVPPPHRTSTRPSAAPTRDTGADRLARSGADLDQQATGHSLGRAEHPIERAAGSPLPRDDGRRLEADHQLAATQTESGQGRPGFARAEQLEKKALLPTEWVTLDRFSDFGQHAREDFEAEVLFVSKSVGSSLDDADLVVDPFDEAQRHLVLLMAIRRDPVPVFLDHPGELVVRLEALPPQGRLPSLEESPRPHLPLVVPQLTEHLLEQIGFVQPPVGLEQRLQRLTPLLRQVGPAGQQCVLLALDEPPVLPREPGVLTLTHLVQGLVQVLEDMELVVEDAGLRRVPRLEGGVAERLPHVHHGQADSLAFPRSQPLEEEVHALLGPVCASEPDRPAADQIADNDTVVLPPADGEFVDADHLRAGRPGPSQLLAHILHLQRLDRLPIEAKFASHIPDRRGPTAAADVVGKPLGVEGVVGQPGQLLLLHGTAAPAAHAPDLDLQVHAGVATREVAHPTGLAVVESSLSPPTRPAGRFFPLRRSRKIRALGSPKMPRTVASGRKPGNRNASSSRRGFRIRVSCRISHLEEKEKTLEIKGFRGHHRQFSTHSVGRRAGKRAAPARREQAWDGSTERFCSTEFIPFPLFSTHGTDSAIERNEFRSTRRSPFFSESRNVI